MPSSAQLRTICSSASRESPRWLTRMSSRSKARARSASRSCSPARTGRALGAGALAKSIIAVISSSSSSKQRARREGVRLQFAAARAARQTNALGWMSPVQGCSWPLEQSPERAHPGSCSCCCACSCPASARCRCWLAGCCPAALPGSGPQLASSSTSSRAWSCAWLSSISWRCARPSPGSKAGSKLSCERPSTAPIGSAMCRVTDGRGPGAAARTAAPGECMARS